jgi:hypothetical protein
MATPAPGTDIGSVVKQAIAEAQGNAATGGKFTWTPPESAGAFDIRGTGIGASLAARGLIQTKLGIQSVDVAGFGSLVSQFDPSQIEALQRQLFESGAYPASYYGKNAKPVPWGQRDPDTVQILQQMAGLATFTGNLDQILGAKVDIGALSRTQRAPLVIELPSEEDMAAVVRDSAMDELGRDASPEQVAAFARNFTARVKAYQEQKYAAGEGGGTVSQPPQAGTLAQEFLRESSPVEAGAQRIEKGLGELRKLFTGGGGGG